MTWAVVELDDGDAALLHDGVYVGRILVEHIGDDSRRYVAHGVRVRQHELNFAPMLETSIGTTSAQRMTKIEYDTFQAFLARQTGQAS